MNKQSRLPREMRVDAQTLAQFADLKQEELEEFRHQIDSGFLPEESWSGSPQGIWALLQEKLRAAWRSGFTAEDTIELVSDVARLSTMLRRLDEVTRMSDAEATQAIQSLPRMESYTFQRVIMMLHLEPWRAQICPICGKHWVKNVQRDRLCSTECRTEARARRNRKYYRKNKGRA